MLLIFRYGFMYRVYRFNHDEAQLKSIYYNFNCRRRVETGGGMTIENRRIEVKLAYIFFSALASSQFPIGSSQKLNN